jgi:CRISPR-associated endonuclease/helicase Cas3
VLKGLFFSDKATARLLEIFPWLPSWDENEGMVVGRLLDASFSHHGSPRTFVMDEPTDPGSGQGQWSVSASPNPFEGVMHLADFLPQWFPDAFGQNVVPLPDSPLLSHMFAGLVMLADWLGSDTRFFPFCGERGRPGPEMDPMPYARKAATTALEQVGLDVRKARQQPLPSFNEQFGFKPYPSQNLIDTLSLSSKGSLTVIEAETGSGKTESALRHFNRLFHAGLVDGLFFACPLRFAAKQLHARVRDCLANTFTDPPPVILAVPGYLRVDQAEGKHLPNFQVLWNEEENWLHQARGWACERPKRFLTAPVAVGTIDQALMAGMRVGHAPLRAAGLSRSLFVVDEVHASDTYMARLTHNLIHFMRDVGGHVLLMSATLGGAVRQSYLDLWNRKTAGCAEIPSFTSCCEAAYPIVWHGAEVFPVSGTEAGNRTRTMHLRHLPLGDVDAVASAAADMARQGACVLVLRNKVDLALQTARAVENNLMDAPDLLFSCHDISTLHHSRFCRSDREALDQEVENRFGKGASRRPGALVSTQTLEQSLDVDFDVLITDLCPVDVLLQRLGRLHRHQSNASKRPVQFATAFCHVVMPDGDDPDVFLSSWVRNELNAGPNRAYEDLRALKLTWDEVMNAVESNTPWHIPQDNRRLVESATHPEKLELCHILSRKWKEHGEYISGVGIAHKQQARATLIDWTMPYCPESASVLDLESDSRLSTRLGLNDQSVTFPSLPIGPFGLPVDRLTIPAWLAPETQPGEEPRNVQVTSLGLEFQLGGQSFVYDRYGLRKRSVHDR